MTANSHKRRSKRGGSRTIKFPSRGLKRKPARTEGTGIRTLQESEEKFRSLVEGASVAVGIADLEGRFTYVNSALADLLGYSKTKLLGHRFIEFLHPEDSARVASTFLEGVSSNREAPLLEFRAVHRDGSVIHLLSRPTRFKINGKTAGFHAIIVDITGRKRMEEELKHHSAGLEKSVQERTKKLAESERRLQYVIGSNPAVIFAGKPRGDYSDFDATFMSERIVSLIGFEPRELIGNPKLWVSRVHPDDLRNYYVELSHFWKEGHHAFEYRFLHKDGMYRWLREEVRLIRDMSGEPLEVIGYWTDVTERKRVEVTLQAAKDYAENLIQTANAVVVGLDNHGNIQVFNQAAERITGYTKKDLEGRNWFEVIVPRDRYPEAWKEFERLTAGGFPKNFENPILTKSGEERYIVWQNNDVREQGQFVGTIFFGIDITERKRLEEELRTARERLECVVSSNPAVIYAGKPLADYSDFVFSYLSERVVSMLGYEPREFVGHPEFWDDHVHPEGKRSVMAEMPLLWKEGRHIFEYQFLHKDGTYRWIREEARVIRDAEGKPVGVNGYWTDVTGKKRMEEALLKAERLAAVGEMATMVAHDLRNPLTGISGAAYYLRKKLGVGADEKLIEMLEIIEKDVGYADRIMRDLLEYSGEFELELSEADPKSITEQALALVSIPTGIHVRNLTNDQPKARLDVEKMKRVFVNLIENAVDAMPRGGELTIQSNESDGSLQIVISDTGTGMAKDAVKSIWTPFFTTKAKGVGLGLSISKRIVEAHKGYISFETEAGKGTSLTVTVPLRARNHE